MSFVNPPSSLHLISLYFWSLVLYEFSCWDEIRREWCISVTAMADLHNTTFIVLSPLFVHSNMVFYCPLPVHKPLLQWHAVPGFWDELMVKFDCCQSLSCSLYYRQGVCIVVFICFYTVRVLRAFSKVITANILIMSATGLLGKLLPAS